MSDYNAFVISGRPKQGQTLDEVKDLFLAEIDKLKKGEFDEGLLEAAINNYKLMQMYRMDRNDGRADMFVSSFIDGVDWKDEVASLDRMSKVTKLQIVDFANKYFGTTMRSSIKDKVKTRTKRRSTNLKSLRS